MVYVILGQTASGKTRLATRLSRDLNLPLIGADAYQVYKELNIGTDKPTKNDLAGITSYLIDDRSVDTPLNVSEYQKECRKILDEYQKKGQDVILSGGTFLYVKAALYPYEFSEEKSDPELEKRVYSLSLEQALEELETKDPESYKSVDKMNPRRVQRALIIALKGQKKSEEAKKNPKLLYPAEIYAINIDVGLGNEKINRRVDQMFEEGLVDEVRGLLSKYDPSLSSLHAIGYTEIIKGLQENQSTEEMKEAIKKDTRHYAKRQRTFLRHQFPGIRFRTSEEIYNDIREQESR